MIKELYTDKTEITEELLDSFINFLTASTGIIPRASHREGIKNYIDKKLLVTRLSAEEYLEQLRTNHELFSEFVNQSTVNETYFFREEKQFALIDEVILPKWRLNNSGKDIKMWSAACSYGEEAYSLAVIALKCGLNPVVFASDINSEVLEHCKSGVFLGTSLRSVDGVSYQKLITQYKREDGRIAFPDKIKNCISTRIMNLSEIDSPQNLYLLPKEQNIIFIRNVFIYFSLELRKKILKIIAEQCLAEDGYLFVSMNEIAQLDSSIVPSSLEKIVNGNIFYFHKKTVKTGGIADGKNLK